MTLRLLTSKGMSSQLLRSCRTLQLNRWICLSCASRQSSSPTSPSPQVSNNEKESSFGGKQEIRDEYIGETKFSMPKVIEIKPIKSLDLKKKIDKVIKYESFIGKLFLGEFDKDFLTFPILLKTRKEFLELSEQYQMLVQSWTKLRKDEQTLDLLGLKQLYNLSVSEMIYVLEAIGASTQNKLSFGNINANQRKLLLSNNDSKYVTIPENALSNDSLNTNKSIVEELIPLIIHNSLSYYSVINSSNEKLKEFILKEKPKIGFAFCEPQENLGSLPYVQWESEAKLTNDIDSWVINGSKSRIFKDNYDYYLIFCRTSDFPEEMDEKNYKFEERKPEDGIVTLLVPKELLTIEDDGTDSYGLEYQKIKFNHLVLSREKHELLKSEQSATLALNVKGCGQIASSAIVLGIVKQLLRNTYDLLINERIGLTECEIVQNILTDATRKVYAIESMLYLTAAMFDAFEPGADCGLEALTVKTLATDYAYDIIKDLRSIHGSRYLVSSTAHDLINVFDAFLDCSINNRMYLGLRGMKKQGSWRHDHIRKMRLGPLYPVYALKHYIGFAKNRRDNPRLDLDLCGYIHPNLKPAADWVEYCLKRLDYGSELLLMRFGKV